MNKYNLQRRKIKNWLKLLKNKEEENRLFENKNIELLEKKWETGRNVSSEIANVRGQESYLGYDYHWGYENESLFKFH